MEILKKLRKIKNVSQKEIADYLNITPQAYGHYENGQREPDIATLRKIAEFYAVDFNYLFGEKEKQYAENQMISIGKDGQKAVYQLSDKDKELFDKLLETYTKRIE